MKRISINLIIYLNYIHPCSWIFTHEKDELPTQANATVYINV